ncbi:MAG: hypothetical protein ACREQ4_00865, partial [Candidatus Binataceae bacterium]
MAKAKSRKTGASSRAKPSHKSVPAKSGIKAKGKELRLTPARKLSVKPRGKLVKGPKIPARARPVAKTQRVTSRPGGMTRPKLAPYRAPELDLPSYDELPVRA